MPPRLLCHTHPCCTHAGLLVWRIEDFKPVPVPKEFYGEFYTGDSYVLLNSFKSSDG